MNMTSIKVGGLDEETVARLKHKAALYGCSLEEAAQHVLKEALKNELTPEEWEEKRREFRALSHKLRAYTRGTHQTPSEVIIRNMRDAADRID